MSPFDYPTIANNPLPDTTAPPEANVVQLQLYTSINDTDTSQWAPWAVFPSPSDDASKISAQNLATFLNTHEYLRHSGLPKAGKDVDSIARGKEEYTSIYHEGYPLPTWIRIEVKQGLVHSWQTRVGEDVTQQIDPAAIEFNPRLISKARLKEGSKLWEKYFNSQHWTPHLRKLVHNVREQANTAEDQQICFSVTVLGTNREPRNRPGYSVACRALLSKGSDAEKAKERRSKKKNGPGKAPVNRTDGSNTHSHSQNSASASLVGEGASGPPPQLQLRTISETPSSAIASAQTSPTLPAPSGTTLSLAIGADVHPKVAPNLGGGLEDKSVTEVLRTLTEPEIDKEFGVDGSGALPETRYRVGLPPSPPTPFARHPPHSSIAPLGSQLALLSSIPPFMSPESPSSIALDMESHSVESDALDATTSMRGSSSAIPGSALGLEDLQQSSHLRSRSTMVVHHPGPGPAPELEPETSNDTMANPSPSFSRRTPPVPGSSQSNMLPLTRQTSVRTSYYRGTASDSDRSSLKTHSRECLGVERPHSAKSVDPASADGPIPRLDNKTWRRLLNTTPKQKNRSSQLFTSKSPRATTLVSRRTADAGFEVTKRATDKVQPQSDASLFPQSPLTRATKRHSDPFQGTPSTAHLGEDIEGVDFIANGDSGDKIPEDHLSEDSKKSMPSKSSTGAAKLNQRTQNSRGPSLEMDEVHGLIDGRAAQGLGSNSDSLERGNKRRHKHSAIKSPLQEKPPESSTPAQSSFAERLAELRRHKPARQRNKTVLRDGSSGFVDWESNGRVPSGDDNSAYQLSQGPVHRISPNSVYYMQSETIEHSSLPHNTAVMPHQEEPGEDHLGPRSNVPFSSIPHIGSLNLDLCQDAAGSYSRLASPAVGHSVLEAVPGVDTAAEDQFTEGFDAESGPTNLAPTIEQSAEASIQRPSRAIRKDRPNVPKGRQLSHIEIPRLSGRRKARYTPHNDQEPHQVSQSAI
ncbi:hypothetical protein FS837_008234 [Tulasnella sp. UAMH 9824]|nr:hypothetical protein FS837_008234 [Tulasnella sp. UAMH 9824]